MPLALSTVLAAGCAMGELLRDYPDSLQITKDDVVGQWCNANGRSLDFGEGCDFSATNVVPRGTVPAVEVDGSGTWELAEDGTEVVLTLTMTDPSTEVEPIVLDAVEADDGDVWLSSYSAGDGGGAISYEKCPS